MGRDKGVGAELLIALAAPFRDARERELAPEGYPYLTKERLARQLNCESDEVLRRRVLRCRNAINGLADQSRRPCSLRSMPLSRTANGTAIGLIPIE